MDIETELNAMGKRLKQNIEDSFAPLHRSVREIQEVLQSILDDIKREKEDKGGGR